MDAVVAVYSDWGIGASGTQPVVLRADRARFRELTAGSTVIVGRRTLADFPEGKPLANRRNIVVTRQPNLEILGARTAHSREEALALAEGHGKCFVIGGASVYDEFFPIIDRVYVTKIDLKPKSDSFFPNLDCERGWIMSGSDDWREENGIRFCFCVYERL